MLLILDCYSHSARINFIDPTKAAVIIIIRIIMMVIVVVIMLE